MAKKENVKKTTTKKTVNKKVEKNIDIINNVLIESDDKKEIEEVAPTVEENIVNIVEEVAEEPINVEDKVVEETVKVEKEINKKENNNIPKSIDRMFGYIWNGQEIDF